MTNTKPKVQVLVEQEVVALVRLFRAVGYGEVRVIVQDGTPVRAERTVMAIKLDAPEDVRKALEDLDVKAL